MATLEAIFFDLDGTLVDGGSAWRSAVKETIRLTCQACPEINPDLLQTAYHDAARVAWESVKIPSPPAWGSMEAESVVTEVWTTALQRLGGAGQDIVTQAASVYYASLQRYGATAYDDVPDCLTRLRRDFRLGVITNGNAVVQQAKIDRAGLSCYFETVITSDIGAGKPDRRIFECASQTMGVRLDASVYVGDLLEWDIGGANGAGMTSVWLNRKRAARKTCDPTPDATIDSLSELPAVIRKIVADESQKP